MTCRPRTSRPTGARGHEPGFPAGHRLEPRRTHLYPEVEPVAGEVALDEPWPVLCTWSFSGFASDGNVVIAESHQPATSSYLVGTQHKPSADEISPLSRSGRSVLNIDPSCARINTFWLSFIVCEKTGVSSSGTTLSLSLDAI